MNRRGGAARRRRWRRDDGGFTLIELMVALSVLTIIIAASTSALDVGLRMSSSTRQQVAAANVVNNVIDELRANALTVGGFDAIPVTTEMLASQTIQGTTFGLSQTAEWVGEGSSGPACSAGSGSALLLRVTVAATWPGDVAPVSSTTTLSPPPGTFSAAEGSLGVAVLSSSSQPVSGVQVTATGGGQTEAITTGSDGCAFFAQLQPATYSVGVGGAANLVDSLDNAPPASQLATVTAGSSASATFDVDQAGSVQSTFGGPTPATGMGISIANTALLSTLPGHFKTYPSASAGEVYPGTYEVFAGSCTDADPLGKDSSGNLFYSPSSTPPTAPTGGAVVSNVTVQRSTPSAVTVPVYTLDLVPYSSTKNKAYTSAASPAGAPPTAVVGASGTTEGAMCQGGPPTWTLSPVTAGASATSVGLGHLAIAMTVVVNGTTMSGTVDLWVTPAGIYTYNPSTGAINPGTPIAFGSAVDVPVS